MKDKKNKILINIIIVILIVLLVILTSINIISLNNIKSEKNETLNQPHSEQIHLDKIEANLVRPQFSVYFFSEYTGQSSQEEIVEALNKLAINIIPKYYKTFKEKSDEFIHQYYEENNLSAISNVEGTNVGVRNEEAFKQMIEKIKNLHGNTLSFVTFKFEKESITSESEGVSVILSISYENNEKMQLKILIKNKDDNGIIVEVWE